MTAFNNWVGGHMSHAELKAMAAAGFVDPKDLMYNKVGDVKGVKPGAHMYESDLFKSNIAEWSWDFHNTYMSRKGATESKFDDLVATMPRNMAALVSFWVHNETRAKRDADTRDRAIGSAASSDRYLATNPTAGLEALKDSIAAFASVVSQPAMQTIGASLQATAHGLQQLAAAYGDFAQKNPEAAKALGIGAGAAGAGAGGYLSWKLLTGFGRLFGFGGSAAAAAEGAGGIGLGGMIGGGMVLPAAAVVAGGAALWGVGPYGPFADYWRAPTASDFPTDDMFEKSRRSRMVYHPGGWVDDPEAARARAMGTLSQHGPLQVESTVHGDATVTTNITITASSELIAVAQAAQQVVAHMALNPVATGHSGRMDSDAMPIGRGGIGHR